MFHCRLRVVLLVLKYASSYTVLPSPRSYSSSAKAEPSSTTLYAAKNIPSIERVRTFVAIFPEKGVTDNITRLTKKLHPHLHKSNVRWTALDNLHFTLCFLGNMEPPELSRVHE